MEDEGGVALEQQDEALADGASRAEDAWGWGDTKVSIVRGGRRGYRSIARSRDRKIKMCTYRTSWWGTEWPCWEIWSGLEEGNGREKEGEQLSKSRRWSVSRFLYVVGKERGCLC